MKRYRLKKRFYVITVTAGLLITGWALVHIDKVCGGSEKSIELHKIEIAHAAEIEPAEEPELISLGEYKITYYCACEACCGSWAKNRPKDAEGRPIVKTASGATAEAGKTIAVDPDVIPYGTDVIINGHIYIAQDCGGAIQGNRIDIYCDSHDEALKNGLDYCEVFTQ